MSTALLLYFLLFLIVVAIVLIIALRPKKNRDDLPLLEKTTELQISVGKIEHNLREEFKTNREENAGMARDNRAELNNTLKEIKQELVATLKEMTEQNRVVLERFLSQAKEDNMLFRDTLVQKFREFQETFDRNVKSFNEVQREKFGQLENRQAEMVQSTEKKLEQMRETVEEKLQKTLSERLGQSFETVGKQLQAVQEGLGEMKNLAQDVGGLKRVLSNVKTRGGVGEVQLEMLLEQILAPDQYEANVKTKKGSNDSVEFAIKLPGRDDRHTTVYLPVDAKFPKDKYENLLNAYDTADPRLIETASREFESTVKLMARDIAEKYLDPPNTTDFGIMFLPFEGIYAEVVRKASLLEDLQRNFKIVVTGPTTLAAILNSLQMGFRTLAIQKRSGEVWQVLAEVKKEFQSFGGMLEKAQRNIHTGLGQLDDVMGKRTRAIQRKLKNVEVLGNDGQQPVLPAETEQDASEDDTEV